MILTQEQVFINNIVTAKAKVNSNSLVFYHEFYPLLKASHPDPFISTSKKLADMFGKSVRTIQRYISDLKDIKLIDKTPIYNNDDPDKVYIEKNYYYTTSYAEELHQQAKYYGQRDRNVNFSHKVHS
jgi:hypothetical protein